MRPVNLLPQQHRQRQATARQGVAYAVVGVLAALFLMALAYTLSANQVNSRKTRTVHARQEADRLQARSAQLNAFGDFAKIKQTRFAAVRQLAQGRFDWERLMRELARVLPGGSWLQTANTSVTGALEGSSAGSSSPSASAGAAAGGTGQPRAELVGCTPHQSDVARMLVGLRGLHRVEDVQLNESSHEDNGDQVTAESCGKLYQFDLTVSFTPDAPEAPKGARKVPGSLGGGS
jgi:Tfp pilus assembly protein PilN